MLWNDNNNGSAVLVFMIVNKGLRVQSKPTSDGWDFVLTYIFGDF